MTYKRFFEMANISPKYSGIKEGIIQIRPEERHINFPHVHYVRNVRKADNEYVKLSISSDKSNIEIIDSKSLLLSGKERDKVFDFIVLNAKILIQYYKQAEFLDTGDFIMSLNKI